MSITLQRINRKFSDQELQDLQTAFALVETTFDFFRGTPPANQNQLLRMGTQNRKFVQVTKNAVNDLAWLLPAYIPSGTYQDEYDLFFQLESMESYLKSMLSKVHQTQLVVGHHLIRDSLDIYQNMQNAHNRGLVEVAPYLNESEERFDYPGNRGQDNEEQASNNGTGDAGGSGSGSTAGAGNGSSTGNGSNGGDAGGGSDGMGSGGTGSGDNNGGGDGSGSGGSNNGSISMTNDSDPGATDGSSGGSGSDPDAG